MTFIKMRYKPYKNWQYFWFSFTEFVQFVSVPVDFYTYVTVVFHWSLKLTH